MNAEDFTYLVSRCELEPDKFTATCRQIPGCRGMGKSMAAAIDDALYAVKAHLEYRKEIGLPLPTMEDKPLLSEYRDRLLLGEIE
jgi:predicted RNase H-like HicB family nuclease